MKFSLSPDKYAELVGSLKANQGASNFTESSVTLDGVDFSWTYEAGVLSVSILAKHGLAHWASDETIFAKLADALNLA